MRGARKAASDENWFKNVPCVVSDVFQALWRDKPVTALKAMLAVAEALPDRSLGSLDGQARRQAEVALLRHAIDILMNGARALDVSQAATVPVLDGIRTKVDKRSAAYDYETHEVDRAPRAQARFASLADAAALRPGQLRCRAVCRCRSGQLSALTRGGAAGHADGEPWSRGA